MTITKTTRSPAAVQLPSTTGAGPAGTGPAGASAAATAVSKVVTSVTKAATSAFEVVKAAVTQRKDELAALDARLQTAGVPDDVRARTVERLGKLDAVDWARETRLLDAALEGPNGDRAVVAWDSVQSIAESSPEAARRLTPEIREALVRGVAESRTADDVGQEGVLGVRQAEEAARALVAMPQAQYDAASRALAQAGGGWFASPKADAQAERALILKAIAARGDRLQPNFIDTALERLGVPHTSEAERAMREVTDFAADVRGSPRDLLIRTTTAIDIEAANTSTIDPNHLPADGAEGTDTRGDNDGLYQRFEDTCGPTTAQLTRAEVDPIYARQLHLGGLSNPDPNSATAQEQLTTLERPRFFAPTGEEVIPTAEQLAAYTSDGTMPPGTDTVEAGSSTSRRAEQARARARDALSTLPDTSDFARAACRKLLDGQRMGPLEQAVATLTLGRLREANGGHPTAAEVRWMQTERTDPHIGMRLDPALRDIATPGTHLEYDATWVGSGGLTAEALNGVDTRLEGGQDVPIRVSNAANTGGHFMLMSDVRGEAPDRRYLVSDPYSGRTAWVPEADLTNTGSDWLSRQFDIGWTQVSHYYLEK